MTVTWLFFNADGIFTSIGLLGSFHIKSILASDFWIKYISAEFSDVNNSKHASGLRISTFYNKPKKKK